MEIILPVLIVAAIGLVAGLGLALASKFMAVPVDERQEKIRECLPGANCGACGYSGCDGYAAAVAAGEAEPDKCAPGGSGTVDALSEILGVKISSMPKIAFIACGGNCESTKLKFEYNGMQTCAAANITQSGPLMCEFGCMGYGDCVRACPFDAIELQNGRPLICEEKCVGCGVCTKVCPKSLISLIPKGATPRVACQNKNKGLAVVKACAVSCIGCGMCEKACEADAIKVTDNVAVIDYTLCTSCGKCKEACKRKCII